MAAVTLAVTAGCVRADELKLQEGTVVRFATVAESRRILADRDDFIKSMSPFDRAVRMKSPKQVSEKEFLDFASQQVRPWQASEKAKVAAVLGPVRKKLAPFGLRLPEVVFLVKTTGLEEDNAPYSRDSAVILPEGKIPRLRESLLIHELFHVFTRNNPDVQKRLYRILGFAVCEDIELPEPLRAIKITNPDAPRINCTIELRTSPAATTRFAPVLLSARPTYSPSAGGGLFAHLKFVLMKVEQRAGKWQPATDQAGKCVLLGPAKVPDYLSKIGRNTGYIIHPEETLAENFVLLVRAGGRIPAVPTPRILRQMKAVLSAQTTTLPR